MRVIFRLLLCALAMATMAAGFVEGTYHFAYHEYLARKASPERPIFCSFALQCERQRQALLAQTHRKELLELAVSFP
jgi:hypothetical protein